MTPITALDALDLFREHEEVHQPWMNAPILIDDFAMATNGHWLVEVDRVLVGHLTPGESPPEKVKARELLQRGWRTFGADATPMAAIALPDTQPCAVCHGAGSYGYSDCRSCQGRGWFVHLDDEYNCKACDSEGIVPDAAAEPQTCPYCAGLCIDIARPDSTGVDVGDNHFGLHYLQLLKRIPGCWFDPGVGGGTDHGQMGLFTFPLQGGYMARGCLMPRRR